MDRTFAEISLHTLRSFKKLTSIEGETEHVHRGAAGGLSQRRFQTRAESTWEHNAALDAEHIVKLAKDISPDSILVSGDDRAVGFLLEKLPSNLANIATRVDAGGLHEEDRMERLHTSAVASLHKLLEVRTDTVLKKLEEELGQRDHAVTGRTATMAALQEAKVETLVVHLDSEHDKAVSLALDIGADVVVASQECPKYIDDKIAAILRY